MRKATEILRDHFIAKHGRGKFSHALAVADSMAFVQYMEQKLQPINGLLNSSVGKQVAENRKKLKSILKTVLLCGHQNLHTSKTIQNELMHACGCYICEKILEEIQEAEYFAVIADEATDTPNCEQLSIVLQFVDTEKNVREKSVEFSECKSGVTGEALADTIAENLASNWQLILQKLCGQAYNRAGAMAGKTRGVAAHIMVSYPKAVYTHCLSCFETLCCTVS